MLRYGLRLSVAVATFLVGLLVSATPAPAPSDAARAPRVGVHERQVLEANRQYLEAQTGGDAAALERLLADDFTIRGRFGRPAGKAERLAMASDPDLTLRYADQGEPWVSADGHAGEVAGVAVVYGSHLGREFGSRPYRYVRRFERRGGSWQLVGVEVYGVERW
jgi:hypothetical protein